MQTAVMNIHNKRRSEPLPLQYDTLNRMTIRNYRHRIKELREKNRIIDIRKEQTVIQPYPFDEKFFITSINANEAITATLIFFQTTEHIGITDLLTCTLLRAIDTRDKHGLYTVSFEPERFGHVDGLLFALFSVEKRDNGSGEQILKLCDEFWHDVAQDITKYPNYEELRLQELYDSMMTKRILIQVGKVFGLVEMQLQLSVLHSPFFHMRLGIWVMALGVQLNVFARAHKKTFLWVN